MDFLWHKVSDKEKEAIKEQAKAIMDDFSKKLSRVGELKEGFIERDECERDEDSGKPAEIDRKIMMSNAPKSNKDFIIAEKKKW
jgi:hypothetical protein